MTQEKLIEIVAQILGLAKDEVTMQSNLSKDFGADSLDLYQIVLAVEEEFGVTIPAEDVQKVQTVSQAVDMVEKLLKQKGN